MLIDITQTTRLGITYRPGSPPLQVEEVCCLSGTPEEYRTLRFSAATHNMGTHIDIMKAGTEIPPERLIGMGVRFDVSQGVGNTVELADLDLSLVKPGTFVFFHTGWDPEGGHEEQQKEISMEVISYLSSKGVNMIGTDAPGLGSGRNHGLIDKFLGDRGQWAIENLANLEALPESGFKVYCLPLKIQGLDALPARILAEIPDPLGSIREEH